MYADAKLKLYLHLNCVLICWTESFEIELFFHIETIHTLNWFIYYKTILTFYCVNKIFTYAKLSYMY